MAVQEFSKRVTCPGNCAVPSVCTVNPSRGCSPRAGAVLDTKGELRQERDHVSQARAFVQVPQSSQVSSGTQGRLESTLRGAPALTPCPWGVEQGPRSTGSWGGCEGGVLQT